MATAVVIGATRGLGRAVAERLAQRGEGVVVGGRDAVRARDAAQSIGHDAVGAVLDLTAPGDLREVMLELLGSEKIDHLVISAASGFENRVADFDVENALMLVRHKLVGYAAAVAALAPLLAENASIVLFGGQGREHPYPGSTMVTAVNGGVTSLVRTLAHELAPRRVNAVHPGVVGDSPRFVDQNLDQYRGRTLTRRLVSTSDVADAVLFLLDNPGVNSVNLPLDSGWLGC